MPVERENGPQDRNTPQRALRASEGDFVPKMGFAARKVGASGVYTGKMAELSLRQHMRIAPLPQTGVGQQHTE